jgi:diguanylate cyclase (GGDEF)-like protein/PAS domain S-box-containing protein
VKIQRRLLNIPQLAANTKGVKLSHHGTVRVSEPLDQYRRLIESLTDYAIFVLSVDGRIASWNSGAKQTFGYDQAEVLGKHYSLIFTAEDIASKRPESELLESLELGKSSVDGWHVRKDGSRFWCTDTVQPLRDESGAVTGFTKIVRDSNERYIASESLRESEERLRLLIEAVTDYAIFSIDLDGAILFWNAGAEHVFGYPESEVIGKHFSMVYTTEAVAKGVPALEIATAARDGHASDEGWHVRRGGGLFYASGQMTRLAPDAGGTPRGFAKIAHDITADNEAHETLKRQALQDGLTQLANRASFTDDLRRSIARAKRHPETQFALIFIDVDHFKNVNDGLGHVTGDKLLVHVARTLERCVRPEDVVARMGGDEFTILLADTDNKRKATSDALRVAGRIHNALQRPVRLDGIEVFTTASMGIAIGSASYKTAEQMLRDADTAMYEAKSRGRSQHVLFDSEMHPRALYLLNLQMDLRRAVARAEFYLDYQPIVSLESGKLVGFEALVRWNHPERGVLLPAQFIAEAENIGLLVEIDRWVLHEACRQIRAWQVQTGDLTLTMSVNISAKDFAHEGLVAQTRDALKYNELAGASLKLEITEGVLMKQHETAATMAALDALGVELEIDDFGTGYSSLSYLARLPLRLLKVDRSFVSQISRDARSLEVVRTVVTLAHNLGLQALAEGIETKQQLTELRALGCEYGQGHWFAPPSSPNDAQSLIGRHLPLEEAALSP